MRIIANKKRLLLRVAVLLFFLLFVLWYTVLKRRTAFHIAQTELFWSYRLWFSGNWALGREILSNIAMFLPFGFLLAAVLGKKRKTVLFVMISALLFSLLIETLQLVLMRGLFEWDDVLNNTVGAVIGWSLFKAAAAIADENRLSWIACLADILIVFICLGLFLAGKGEAEEEEESEPSGYCFQIDEVRFGDHSISLSGFAFVYRKPAKPLGVVLLSTNTGRRLRLTTESGLTRTEVNDYFFCEYDYSHSGFTASGETDLSEEYEVMIQFPWSVPIPTGVYVSASGVRRFSKDQFTAPDIEADFTADGTLLVCRPDHHCWVYQYDGALYWIADPDFCFEEDGTTYIQYQLWTTQTEKLPQKRLEKGNLWDNIGGYFETYEIRGDWNGYRVMKRELPSAYAITSIETGYYKNGSWIWKEFFRPVYALSK